MGVYKIRTPHKFDSRKDFLTLDRKLQRIYLFWNNKFSDLEVVLVDSGSPWSEYWSTKCLIYYLTSVPEVKCGQDNEWFKTSTHEGEVRHATISLVWSLTRVFLIFSQTQELF